MITGPAVVSALQQCGVTHLVWIPDSELGTWEQPLAAQTAIRVVRVCREGEAFAVAAGLMIGGKQPVVAMQCTGFFEAGDSFRNFVHDFKLPLFCIVGLRSYLASQKGPTVDTCPKFALPILDAWQVPYVVLTPQSDPAELADAYRRSHAKTEAFVVCLAE
jgi:sulfopyruvate decarboxylase TPP-binding subunit